MLHRADSRTSKAFWRSLPLALLLAACGGPSYTLIEAGPLTRGQVWQGMSEVAVSAGYPPGSGTDQGFLIYESQWREGVMQDRHPGRTRLHLDAQPLSGFERRWVVRYYVEQQRVDDPSLLFARIEEDWESDGQDAELEMIIGEALRLRLGVQVQQTGVRDPSIR